MKSECMNSIMQVNHARITKVRLHELYYASKPRADYLCLCVLIILRSWSARGLSRSNFVMDVPKIGHKLGSLFGLGVSFWRTVCFKKASSWNLQKSILDAIYWIHFLKYCFNPVGNCRFAILFIFTFWLVVVLHYLQPLCNNDRLYFVRYPQEGLKSDIRSTLGLLEWLQSFCFMHKWHHSR